ncbi:Dehydrogenase/reductase SDR member 12 [Irineochytrium annulatum]|nr:Dehydrogenase/reductase SDR member 12 [Irineochytrium annulatum]
MPIVESLYTVYRSILFSAAGLVSWTKQGFEGNAANFTPGALDVDLQDKIAIITGGNSGLGKEAVRELAKRNSSVYMLCRDAKRGGEARSEIVEETGNERIYLEVCDSAMCFSPHRLLIGFYKVVDVSRPRQIADFVERISKKPDAKLDILINNAGILPATWSETPDGIEAVFATNTLSTYALTRLLMPLLERSDDPRVINVSSGGMYNKRLDPAGAGAAIFSKSAFEGTLAYAQTKRQQVELTEYWATKHPKVRFYSMHPDTTGVRTSLPGFYSQMKARLRTASQGADTIVWAAVTKEKLPRSGAFLFDRKEERQHVTFGGTVAAPGDIDKLVEHCEELLKKSTTA